MSVVALLSAVPETLALYRDGGRSKMREEGRCRMCLTPRRRRGVRQLTRHHIVPKVWFTVWMQRLDGDDWTRAWKLRDAEANIVPLCATCHRAVEIDVAARAMLRKVLGGNEVAFAVRMRGEAWFERRYPRLGVSSRAGHTDEALAREAALVQAI